MKKTDTIIIGSGLTGLSTAHYLTKEHKDFLVLEKNSTYGGVIKTNRENGFTFEEGPNTGVLGTIEVVELFEDLKDYCQVEVAGENVKKRYILKEGKWNALPSGLGTAVGTPLFSLKDKFRILAEPFRKPGDNPHESLAELVKRRMGQSFLDYAIDPFILGVYSGDPNLLVPKYALPKLYNLEQNYGSFIGGSVKKKFEKKEESQKKVTRKVFSAKGGLSNLTKAIYEKAGKDKFHFNLQDLKIVPNNDKYYVTGIQNGKNIEFLANKIITTTGSFALPELLPFIAKSDIEKLSNLYYAKVIEIVLGWNTWNGFELDGFGGLIPHKEKRDLLGVLFLSSLLTNKAPDNGALLTLFMGGVRRSELTELSDDEVKKIVKAEIMDLMDLNEFKPDLMKIIRHNNAIPQYAADSGERFKTIEKLQNQYNGLILGGNMRDGIGMADRVKQGKILANQVLQLDK